MTDQQTIARWSPDTEYIGTGEYLGTMVPDMGGDYVLHNDYITALDEARRENERLRETLEWYADRDGAGKDFLIYQKNDKSHYVISDVHQLGSRARSALAAGEPKENR